MGQLSRQFSTLHNSGGFGGNTQDNPKNESCNAINLRNRVVPFPEVGESSKKTESKKRSEEEVEQVSQEGVENERQGVVENERKEKNAIEKENEGEVEQKSEIEGGVE
ncbi:hypothetical protein A2U01_0062726, partial [Trifolium medium]|nr:hypothetical protein [Trifolium medium]